jgi:CP family cyanate transporter-like MFS transporter
MRAPYPASEAPGRGQLVQAVLLLWLAGTGLRMTILAVPPVIPMIRDDLALSATEVGVLTGLPSVLFAVAAIPGSLLIARFGALATLIFGLLATAAGSAFRGAAPNIWLLYAATVLTGFGVAVMQPSLPPLVRAWLPDRIGFGTAVFTNGLLVGEVLPVALTLPLVVPLVGGSWRVSFFAWAIPCVAIAVLIALFAPGRRAGDASGFVAGRKWWPDWRSGTLWRIGIMFGTVNAIYFTTNAFVPELLARTGRPDLISITLTALNLGQIPASLLLLAFAGRLVGKAWPYLACGALCFAALMGIIFGSPTVVVAAAALIGFSCAAVLTISYSCAVITPVVSGLAWDLTGVPRAAFVPVLLGAVVLAGLAPGLGRALKTGHDPRA